MKYILTLILFLIIGYFIAEHNGGADIVSVLAFGLGVPFVGFLFYTGMK